MIEPANEEFSLEKFVPGALCEADFREWIFEIEGNLMKVEGSFDRHDEEGPVKLEHTFTPGLYTRQIFMPAGALIVSRIHMFEHPFIISKGSVSVYNGKEIVRINAPYQGVTPPGTKRILYVHEDTIWTTFHVTDKETLEEIDENGVVTCDTFEEFDKLIRKEITI